MKIEELRRHWEAFGRDDPFWAVLTEKEGPGDEWDPERFFAAGDREIDSVLEHLDSLGVDVARRNALDFGCGVGRLTQSLCRHFEYVDGVDISASMLELANRLNRNADRCRYHLNTTDDLRLFEDAAFDFVYSRLVLQHIEPTLSSRYIEEFVRVLAPGGVTVFQVPSHYEEAAVRRLELAPSGFRSQIEILDAPSRMRPGEQAIVRVQVTNRSSCVWPGPTTTGNGVTSIRLGNHWLRRTGRVSVRDDGRVSFRSDLRPGESVILELPIVAPDGWGRQTLQLDMVQEGVAWFADRGSLPATVDVRVYPTWKHAVARLRRRSTTQETFVPVMEAHGIPREQVERMLTDAGASVLDVSRDDALGLGWISYRYVARRDAAYVA